MKASRCEDHVAHYICRSCLRIYHDYSEADKCCTDVNVLEDAQ